MEIPRRNSTSTSGRGVQRLSTSSAPPPTSEQIAQPGPSDVEKEIAIVKEVIAGWNQTHWETIGWELKTQHWNTDAIPTMAERGQAAIDHQLIDESDIVIAILWTRLGTPTGLAKSGTEEEITRVISREIHVLAYFSDLEAPGTHDDKNQTEELAAFRSKMMKTGLPFTFKSRRHFRDMFERHLDAVVRKLLLERSIKSKMSKMGQTEADYYAELSNRMNMKKHFTSLTKLSKHDLGRVDTMVKYDYNKWWK